MPAFPLDDDFIRCLAHTTHKCDWCPRRDSCARNLTIRHDSPSCPAQVRPRLCTSDNYEMFIAVESDNHA